MAPLDSESDEKLLRRAAGGDSESFGALFRRHRRRVWGFLLRATASPEESEELLQEVFLRVLQRPASFRRGRFATWLYAIALNLVRDRWRRKQVADRERSKAGPEASGSDPSDQAVRAETAERVREAIERLPEPQRTAILLSRYEGLSYQEIAELEECAVDAIKQRVRRAMVALGEKLKDLR